MTDHLSPAECIDAFEGTLPRPRAAHVDGCVRCREELEAVRGAIRAAEAVDVHEPSPLYWEHLAARVRERVAAETIAPAWRADWREWLSPRALVPIASAVALVGAVFVAGEISGRRAPVSPSPAAVSPAASVAPAQLAVDPDESEAWQVLTAAASEVPVEEAHAVGMGVPAGAVDRAVQRMTPAELDALRQLLQSELHHSGD